MAEGRHQWHKEKEDMLVLWVFIFLNECQASSNGTIDKINTVDYLYCICTWSTDNKRELQMWSELTMSLIDELKSLGKDDFVIKCAHWNTYTKKWGITQLQLILLLEYIFLLNLKRCQMNYTSY